MDRLKAKQLVSPLPETPGPYFWGRFRIGYAVDVYRKPGERRLYFKTRHGVELVINNRTPGYFIKRK